MLPATFPTMFRGNPKITTHTGQKPPYGYVDWWPLSLYVNNEVAPFDDKDVRWALSHYIDRNQIVQVAFLGASQVSALPMPPYKPLLPYFDAVKDLLAKYDTLEFNPKKGDALLTQAGIRQAGWQMDRPGRQTADAGDHQCPLGTFGPAIGPVGLGDAAAPRRGRQPDPAAGLQRPVPEGPVCRFHLWPRRQHPRTV